MNTGSLKAAVVQMVSGSDPAANIQTMRRLVRDAAQGVLHIAEIEERKILIPSRIVRHEAVPRRTLAACHHTIAVTLPMVEVGEPRHVESRLAAARSEHFARGGNVDNGGVVFVAQLQIRGLQHRVALPTHIAREGPLVAEGEQHA